MLQFAVMALSNNFMMVMIYAETTILKKLSVDYETWEPYLIK